MTAAEMADPLGEGNTNRSGTGAHRNAAGDSDLAPASTSQETRTYPFHPAEVQFDDDPPPHDGTTR
ncbi:hypothetical protein ACL02S_15940 [Nocardia sp. 004]|uniref:hypothetical protein n=1 Tax=Nocardia sp. 004 TaxID=3385978 RepID=UPI00399F080F